MPSPIATTWPKLRGRKLELLVGGKTSEGEIVAVTVSPEREVEMVVRDDEQREKCFKFPEATKVLDDAVAGITFSLPSQGGVVRIQ